MMKKNRLITFILLLFMSFSMLHAYVIDELDTHPCSTSEYVHNFTAQNDCPSGDICHIHHFFHIAYILPEVHVKLLRKSFGEKPYTHTKTYEYNSLNNFLKPPIQS